MKNVLVLLFLIMSLIALGETKKKREDLKREVLKTQKHVIQGDVSNYGGSLHGSKLANGLRFNQWAMTAAHKTLPFGTIVRVTNKSNGKSVIVTINDRGPYIKGRTIDLSRGAFQKIAPLKQGIIKSKNVKIEILKYGNGKTYHKKK